MNKQQPEALRLAEMLTADEWPGSVTLVSYARECVAELLRQHARITELESQLAQRFDAADMATAAAQGFMDGAAKEQQAEWQSIETAPKDGSRILLHPAVEVADDWSKGHWNSEHECWIVGGSPSGVVHTAWHPLPPAPSTEGESNG